MFLQAALQIDTLHIYQRLENVLQTEILNKRQAKGMRHCITVLRPRRL